MTQNDPTSSAAASQAPPVPPVSPVAPVSYQAPPLAGLVIPFGNIIGPLVVWLMKKNEIPFVDDQGKESLNFQITIAIALVVSFLLVFVLVGFLLLPAVGIFGLVFTIIAGIKANEGQTYRYPFAIRLIK
jgi:uncharacterized protein